MLTCRWCGLRPTEEFASLEEVLEDVACGAPADDAAGGVGEWWWHRLGCGRPFVVRLTPAPSRAGLPAVDRATRSRRWEPLEARTAVLRVDEPTEVAAGGVEVAATQVEDVDLAAVEVQVEDAGAEGMGTG